MFMPFAEQARGSFRPPANYENKFSPNIGIQGDGGRCTMDEETKMSQGKAGQNRPKEGACCKGHFLMGQPR